MPAVRVRAGGRRRPRVAGVRGRRGLGAGGRERGDARRRRQALEDARQVPPVAQLRRLVDQGDDRGQGDQDQQQPTVADPGGSGRPSPPRGPGHPAPAVLVAPPSAGWSSMRIQVGSTASPVSLTPPLARSPGPADTARECSRPGAIHPAPAHACRRRHLGPAGDARRGLPAAAETAAQCHAAINQYRAKAGLDKASSTSIKALAVAAGRHAADRVNVDPGDSILLSALGLPT
jgi:hypothetical protein